MMIKMIMWGKVSSKMTHGELERCHAGGTEVVQLSGKKLDRDRQVARAANSRMEVQVRRWSTWRGAEEVMRNCPF